jgi:hypothetical protein
MTCSDATRRKEAATINSPQRQVMDNLRSGDWKIAQHLSVPASQHMLDSIYGYGWIERRGEGPHTEIRITPAGLDALRAPR